MKATIAIAVWAAAAAVWLGAIALIAIAGGTT
jgi:hypothetical protein